jgi:protocatechuate 3,4-dioxygenase beta subunit
VTHPHVLAAVCFASGLLAAAASGQAPAAAEPQTTNVLNGRVVDQHGAPMAGVQVAIADATVGQVSWDTTLSAFAPEQRILLLFHKRNSTRAGTATTDAQGSFTLRSMSLGRYNVAALSPEGQLALHENVEFSADGPPLTIVVDSEKSVVKSVFLYGRVVDAQGRPLQGATVTAADANEGYMFGNPMTGDVQTFATPWRDERFPWFSSSEGLTGSGASDASGSFMIAGLRPGVFNLVVRHAEGVQIVQAFEVREGLPNAELRVDPPTYVQGTFSADPAIRSLYSYMQLTPEGLSDRIGLGTVVRVQPDGTFRAGPLPPVPHWTLRASQPIPGRSFVATLFEIVVEATPGKTVDLNVDLTAGSKLSGDVRGPTGEPLAGVAVLARALEGSPRAFGAVSGNDGKYVIPGLVDGSYELSGLRHAPRTGPG